MAQHAYRFRDVTFRLDGDDDYNCQVTRGELVATSNISTVDTLCGPQSSAGRSQWALELEGLQNWFTYSSLVMYLNNNGGKEASFSFVWTSPDDSDTITVTGTCILVETGFGGTAEELATFSVTLPVNNAPTFTRSVGS